MTDHLKVDIEEINRIWEDPMGPGSGKMQIKKEIENRKMRELVELATTLKELKPVILMLVARQGNEL
jgi:hypothetical protein